MLLLLLNESFSVQSLYWLVQRKFQLSYFDNEFKLDQVSALILQYTFREIKIYFVPVEDDSVQFSFKGRYLKNLFPYILPNNPSSLQGLQIHMTEPIPASPISSHLLCSSLLSLTLSFDHTRLFLALCPLQSIALSTCVLWTPTFSMAGPSHHSALVL